MSSAQKNIQFALVQENLYTVASTENHEPACVQGNGKPASSVQENMQMVLVRENMKTASTSYKGGKHEKGFNGV